MGQLRATSTPSALLTAPASSLLSLPAELRVYIYELVLGGNFFHAEIRPHTSHCKQRTFNQDAITQLVDAHQQPIPRVSPTTQCLHFYPCNSPVSEDAAYRRSRDLSLNEQVAGEAAWLENHWKMGDAFHIDSCEKRHMDCYPHQFSTPRSYIGLTVNELPDPVHHVHLYDVLGLSLLQTCSQVYHEAKSIPLARNTFGFRHPFPMLHFLLLLDQQSTSVRSIWLSWRLTHTHPLSLSTRWNKWLAIPALSTRLSGLRVLHLSISISHDTDVRGPAISPQDVLDQGLHKLAQGLEHLRNLPLERVTVILSDDRHSMFGDLGCPLFLGPEPWDEAVDSWLAIRRHSSLRAAQKRDLAEQLRKHMLRIDSEEKSPK